MTVATVGHTNTGAPSWSARNQEWLSRRFAFWRTRLDELAADPSAAVIGEPPVPGIDDAAEPAALGLANLFGLSPFETELLVVTAGLEIDAALRLAVARAQRVRSGRPVRLRFSVALGILPQPHWDALSPVAPLRRWALVTVDDSAGMSQAELRIDERVLHHLTGVAAFDERLQGVARLDAGDVADAGPLPDRIARALQGVRGALVMLTNVGRDPVRRRVGRAVACATFERLGLRTLWVDARALPSDARDLSDAARRLDREAGLSSAGIALALDAETVRDGRVARAIDALRSPVITVGAIEPLQLADFEDRPLLRFSVQPVPADARQILQPFVRNALRQFHAEPAVLQQAISSIDPTASAVENEQAVWTTLRESTRGGLEALTRRIESRTTFDDLVVPPAVLAQLREIASQLAHRATVYDDWGFGARESAGLGVAALFAGESGTGKTFAAEAIANEARLDLYRIDLASVVSKYIGETEKNLSQVFDAAEQSGALLLFDEADALFGKRSEVKDSHDRYANIEIAYLLQRIESYRGLAILTTNFRGALDRAFLRRIRFVVQFPFPDAAARAELWRRQFPPTAPLGDVDYAGLARLQLSGGHIRSVVLNAAFAAAGRAEPIGQRVLMDAARAEFAKLERPLSEAAIAESARSGGRR